MHAAVAFTLFDTSIGACAVAWNDIGLVGVWLPEPTSVLLRARIARRHPDAIERVPPPPVAGAIAAIAALLAGERVDLSGIALDETRVDGFDRHVYAASRRIPPGRAVTYGELAARVGAGASARAIGQSLGRNPFPLVVPCHRIVASGGDLGGFSAPGGSATKRRLLDIEGARLDRPDDLFDAA